MKSQQEKGGKLATLLCIDCHVVAAAFASPPAADGGGGGARKKIDEQRRHQRQNKSAARRHEIPHCRSSELLVSAVGMQ